MRNKLNLLIVILSVLAFSFFVHALDKPKEKRGYLIEKYIDTVEVTGKHVPDNIYGLTFNLVYQEDKTSIRETKKVDKEEYNLSEVNTELIITYTTK
jgi:hypothetical protein